MDKEKEKEKKKEEKKFDYCDRWSFAGLPNLTQKEKEKL